MGLGAFPAPHQQWLGHARHARHPHRQLRDGRGRPDRARSAPASTTASPASSPSSRRARSSSTSTSTRPRSPRTSRRTSRSSATPRTSCPSSRAEYRALEPDGARLEELVAAASTAGARSTRCATRTPTDARDQAAAHDPGALRGHRRRRDRHLRRRPAPDVGRAVLPLRAPAPLDQLRRPRHDGLRPARRRWARRSAARTSTVVCLAGDGSLSDEHARSWRPA